MSETKIPCDAANSSIKQTDPMSRSKIPLSHPPSLIELAVFPCPGQAHFYCANLLLFGLQIYIFEAETGVHFSLLLVRNIA
uniref:Uncharacterized protein n=1 Tax=Physcomitrium patens TaxID=3218 RepID=A0A2K1L1G6_PHYPA|nr:hypothetical protein PHYPA_002661 [Physcomitrium patens]